MGAAMNRNQGVHSAIITQLFFAIQPKFYVELGTYDGATINPLAAMFTDCRFVAVDRVAPRNPVPRIEYFTEDIDVFLLAHLPTLGKPDLIFMDADHSKVTTKRWYERCVELAAKDALILIHDTNPETEKDRDPGLCGDCEDFAKTLGNAVTLPYHPGLTIARVA